MTSCDAVNTLQRIIPIVSIKLSWLHTQGYARLGNATKQLSQFHPTSIMVASSGHSLACVEFCQILSTLHYLQKVQPELATSSSVLFSFSPFSHFLRLAILSSNLSSAQVAITKTATGLQGPSTEEKNKNNQLRNRTKICFQTNDNLTQTKTMEVNITSS